MEKNNSKLDKVLRIILKALLAVVLILFIACFIKTCADCRTQAVYVVVEKTGYLPDKEKWDNIPDVKPPVDDDKIDSLPEAVSLEAFFPPIGNQGRYGTCVAWAVGYNLKTALNAIDNHWTPAQLADPANQTSPKDLWMGIPTAEKGFGSNHCNGTAFEPAFSVLASKGVSNMKDVPYSSLGGCTGTQKGDTANKIASFSHITVNGELPSIKQIKNYIKDTIPLAISAHLGDNFMTWNSDQPIKTDNYLSASADHAYHAMVLSGYDDARHAFRVRNSWGETWGDNGSIWVDYDFFVNGFCVSIFQANNK